jgi:membrane protease YdiL (CAAX protease family)
MYTLRPDGTAGDVDTVSVTDTLLAVANLDEAERTRWRTTVVGAVALLVLSNVMANRVIPNWLYVPWNVSVALLLIWIGRHEVTRQQMGFTQWKRGLLWGGALFGATALVLLIGLALPATRDMFDDKRVTDSVWAWVYHAFLRIPVGTAFMEETAFRAVLPALFAVRWGVLRGCIAASALFGLWHVLPSLGLHNANPTVTDLLGTGAAATVVTVAFAVVGTALTGLVWCWIRYRSGSVLATIIGHVATNSVAYTIAFWVNR